MRPKRRSRNRIYGNISVPKTWTNSLCFLSLKGPENKTMHLFVFIICRACVQLIYSFTPFLRSFAHWCIDNWCFLFFESRQIPQNKNTRKELSNTPDYELRFFTQIPVSAADLRKMNNFYGEICTSFKICQLHPDRCNDSDATGSSRKKWISATARLEILQRFESSGEIDSVANAKWDYSCPKDGRWSGKISMRNVANVKNKSTTTTKHIKTPQSKGKGKILSLKMKHLWWKDLGYHGYSYNMLQSRFFPRGNLQIMWRKEKKLAWKFDFLSADKSGKRLPYFFQWVCWWQKIRYN